MVMQHLIIATITLVLAFVAVAEGGACNVSAFHVQANFSIDKYSGTWYEIKWRPQAFIPVEDRYPDYSHTYTRINEKKIAVTVNTRTSANGSCIQYSGVLHLGDTPGKLLYQRKFNDTADITADYWIMATDYDTFAFVYGCRQKSQTGQCLPNMVDSWVWSRKKSLTPVQENMVDILIGSLCVKVSDYISTSHVSDCVPSSPASSPTLRPPFSSVLLVLVFMGLHNINKWISS